MGKKATSYLIYVITIYTTLGLSLISTIGWFAQRADPSVYWVPSLLGLALMPLLFVDFALLIFWAIKRKFWVIAPAIALIVNMGFITATLQVSFSSNEGLPHDLKVASYNVHGFRHGTFKMTVEIIAELLKSEGVDVVCFQEFGINNAKFNMDSIQRVLGFMPYVYAPENNGRGRNLAIFSKYPFTSSQLISFKDTDNSAIWVDMSVKGRTVRLFNTHFQTTSISQSQNEIDQLKGGLSESGDKQALYVITGRLKSNFVKRAAQVKTVRSVIDQTNTPIIVCGDFNDTPASYVYNQMKRGLKDSFQTSGSGYAYTYNGMKKLLRIDYILYSDHMDGVRYYSLDQELSDHNPVLFELSFRD